MKHTVKKLFATFLSIAMIFSICLMPAYAADNDGQKTRAISPQNGAVLATLAYSDENTEVYYIPISDPVSRSIYNLEVSLTGDKSTKTVTATVKNTMALGFSTIDNSDIERYTKCEQLSACMVWQRKAPKRRNSMYIELICQYAKNNEYVHPQPPATASEISDAEERLKIKFPTELRELLLEMNGDKFLCFSVTEVVRNNLDTRSAFEEFTDQIIVRENKGLDVWAYKTALDHYGCQAIHTRG